MNIKELGHKIFYQMQNYSQLIIDMVQELEDIENNYEEMDKQLSFQSLSCQADLILEIIDTERVYDVEALKSIIEICKSKVPELKL